MKKITLLNLLILCISGSVLQAQIIINPVSATTTLSAQFSSTLDNTLNGAGLNAFPSTTATHGMSSPSNSYVATVGTGTIDFDLGGSYLIDGLTFWNQNFFGPSVGASGINDVIISSSADGITFTPIQGSPSIFAKTTCMTCPGEQFSFTPVATSFIRFEVVSNHGSTDHVAFSEIAFSGSLAPAAGNVINPVSAKTTLIAQFGSSLASTIDGSGLTSFPALTGDHEATNPFNSFLATNDTGSIDFDLGGNYRVEGLTFWNENGPGPGGTGIQDVVISSSIDGINFTPIAGAPMMFTQVMSPISPAEQFSFTAVSAKHIRFDVVSNYGDMGGLVAFAEVAFEGTIIPLSVSNIDLFHSISIYPNPALDFVTLENNSNTELEGVKIYDISGRLLQDVVITNSFNHRINISNLSTGIYMFHIYGDHSSTIKKVIKR
jgi:hypothetical protein